jgi:diguanylate cyclase (GGDEF)-like protein
MSGAGFILAINLVVAGLVAASFVMIALYDRVGAAPRWMAISYLTGMAYFVCELLIPLVGPSQLSVPVSFSIFLAATAAFNVGLAHHYHVAAPWRLMTALFVLSAVEVYLIQDLPRHSLWRMTLYQAPYALMQLIGLWIVWRSRARDSLDTALMILLGASALQFLSKPLLAAASGGWGSTPQLYIGSTYAMISQTLGAVFGFAMALLTLVILTRAILTAATQRSETDTLSGLLNRGGFEARAELALREATRRGMPASLVIADIDRFKLINDTFGHASGDRVIEAFAAFIGESAGSHQAAGRIGGEEFAILLPGANLGTARLFAEGTRSAFAGLSIDGLPDHRRVTASFGVAELLPGESIAELLARADVALYAAKNEGRNCVRVASTNVTRFPRQMVG